MLKYCEIYLVDFCSEHEVFKWEDSQYLILIIVISVSAKSNVQNLIHEVVLKNNLFYLYEFVLRYIIHSSSYEG